MLVIRRRYVRPEEIKVKPRIIRMEDGYLFDSESKEYVHERAYFKQHGILPLGWHVHHIDYNKRNNNLENLIGIPQEMHDWLMRTKRKVKREKIEKWVRLFPNEKPFLSLGKTQRRKRKKKKIPVLVLGKYREVQRLSGRLG